MSIGETMSLNCGYKQSCCTFLRLRMSMERYEGMILTGET
jgi:hypothetical protein